MINRWNLTLALAMALGSASSVAFAADANVTLSSEQRAALLSQAAAIGTQQERLAELLVGDWQVTISLLMDPQHPVVEQGRSNFSRVLGGRHVLQDLRFSSAEGAFEGLGYFGYDNVTGQYFSSWMDTTFTGAMLAFGTYDVASNTYTFLGSQSDPLKEVTAIPVREVLHVVAKDRFTYEYYETRRNQEKLAVRLEYKRLP